MSLSGETPKLPKWVFVGGDLALVATACVIAAYSAHPLSRIALVAIAGCVALGAVLICVPFLADYARDHDLALKERQDALEALTRTTAATSEQIAIAAASIHEIASSAEKRLREADQAAYGLLERLAEVQGVLADARDSGKEETARLESSVDRIAQLAAASAKADAATRSGWMRGIEAAEARAAGAADRAERAAADLAGSLQPPLAALEAAATALRETVSGLDSRMASLERGVERAAARPTAPRVRVRTDGVPLPAPEPSSPVSGDADSTAATSTATATAAVTTVTTTAATESPRGEDQPGPDNSAQGDDRPAPPALSNPAPNRLPQMQEALEPATQASLDLPSDRGGASLSVDSSVSIDQEAPGGSESSVSADGATRLLITAYIGIGNRLFIRGEGPGLSWTKGIPLQFVSIGKWRWETPEAVATIRFKLYKNDQLECVALGERAIEPGRQQDVSARF